MKFHNFLLFYAESNKKPQEYDYVKFSDGSLGFYDGSTLKRLNDQTAVESAYLSFQRTVPAAVSTLEVNNPKVEPRLHTIPTHTLTYIQSELKQKRRSSKPLWAINIQDSKTKGRTTRRQIDVDHPIQTKDRVRIVDPCSNFYGEVGGVEHKANGMFMVDLFVWTPYFSADKLQPVHVTRDFTKKPLHL